MEWMTRWPFRPPQHKPKWIKLVPFPSDEKRAGLSGSIVGEPLGFYDASKKNDTFAVVALLMKVKQCAEHWPEEDWRQRCWVSKVDATELLQQPELVDFLKAAAKRLRS